MTFQPSEFQQDIYNWIETNVPQPEQRALLIEAVAGSGKTTTIVEACKLLSSDLKVAFLAFNKSIATELGSKLPDFVEAKTLNALGFATYRYNTKGTNVKIERNKTRDLIRKGLPEQAEEVIGELMNLVAKAKSHGLIPNGMATPSGTYQCSDERWTTLMDRYDIDINGTVELGHFLTWAEDVLRWGLEQMDVIDFDDQLYMPVALDMRTWGYDVLFIDEAQDVSHVQRVLLRKFVKHGTGKIIMVGDSRQAIYGFRGADSQSMANLKRVFKADELPLSITYRCPRKVTEIAQRIVPHISCSDTAEDGEVLNPKDWDVQSFSDSDLIVCRNTAPLIELAYRCIAEGVQVKVMGREIGKGLINVIKKAGGKHHASMLMDQFTPRLGKWAERMLAKAKDDESKQAAVTDKLDCIRVIATGADTVAEVIASIDALFSDTTKGATLATVHKAKGLEAPRVFILEPDLMPSKWARKEWQVQQESNLEYVAVTRALETLVYLPLAIVS